VHLQKVLEVMPTSVYTSLKLFNSFRKHFLQICVRKVAVHLQKILEVMFTSVYTGLNLFNSVYKHFADLRSESRCALKKGVGSDGAFIQA
jgi:hypothetical protein